MEEPGRLQSMGSLESDTTERLPFHFSLSCIGERNGNPLQCSCLENPRDGKPGGLLSMGSHRVGHNWSDLAAAAAERIVPRPWSTTMTTLYWVGHLRFILIIMNFSGGSDSKASVYNAGDPGSIPGLGRSPGEGNGNPLQYYFLENAMDRGAW